MDSRTELAAASRDGHLALRRVERRQVLIERLHAARGQPVPLARLAERLAVSARTVARDVERLRLSGVPLRSTRGRAGGVVLARVRNPIIVRLDLPEAAALMSSLAVLDPTVSDRAASAMHKLVVAIDVDDGAAARRSGSASRPAADLPPVGHCQNGERHHGDPWRPRR